MVPTIPGMLGNAMMAQAMEVVEGCATAATERAANRQRKTSRPKKQRRRKLKRRRRRRQKRQKKRRPWQPVTKKGFEA